MKAFSSIYSTLVIKYFNVPVNVEGGQVLVNII